MVILMVMPVVGCANSSETGLNLEAELEALRQTCAASEEVQSYRVEISSIHIEEGKNLEGTLEVEFVAPDRYHYRGYGDVEQEESIIIGNKVYSRDSENDQWQEVEMSPNMLKAQKLSLKSLTPSAESTFQLLDSLTDLEKLPEEEIDGVDCLHCRGRVDMERKVEKQKAELEATLDPSEPGYQERLNFMEWQRKWKINEELWISREDCFVRQRKSETQMPATQSPTGEIMPAMQSPTGEIMQGEAKLTMLMHYYDINEPIKIEPPKVVSNPEP
jgi:hypothetical protein